MQLCKKFSMAHRLTLILFFVGLCRLSGFAQYSSVTSLIDYLNAYYAFRDSVPDPILFSDDSLYLETTTAIEESAEKIASQALENYLGEDLKTVQHILDQDAGEKLRELSGFTEFSPNQDILDLGRQAMNHFSGKEEVLHKAIRTLSDLRLQSEKMFKWFSRSDSGVYVPKTFSIIIGTGFFRPLSPTSALDLYPSFGIACQSKISVFFGWTRRIGSGGYFGNRYVVDYVWKKGLSVQLELERLTLVKEGGISRRSHMLTGVKKSIVISERFQSYVLTLIDWGRQMPDDGYAERYRIRAGIDYLLWKK